ncbi:MAG: helix-turn-helix domain-containing protein [Candidatus Aenigmarchaeota archaeon]|nr:helix-turn-helix domain-containing protein [Candidatus Aenigmarchaeota archaeon]
MTNEEHEIKNNTGKIALKKLVKQLAAIKGRHTELVTVYVPAGYSLNEVATQLRNEQGTADNIKSKAVRKNVTTALEKILRHLTLYKRTPENGVALFCGNVSETDKTDMQLWAIEPPEEIKTKLYWCDQKFVTEPLEDMIADKEIYGIICLDKSEATIALLKGKRLEIIYNEESIVPGKSRAGGQCLSPDTLVQVSDGSILEIKDLHNPCAVKSVNFSDTTSLKDTPVIEKWNTKKNLMHIIKTKYPTIEIESSADHTFFRWGNKVEEVPAEQLKAGDYLLMPEKIEIKGKIQSLEPAGLYNTYELLPEGSKFIKYRREDLKLLQKELAKKSNVTQTAISVLELGKRNVKKGFLMALCQSLNTDFNSFVRQFCKPATSLRLPNVLDEKLAEFLGYFAGDGSFEKERLSLHDSSKQIVDYYTNLGKSIFNCNTHSNFREKKNYHLGRLYGKPIVTLIKSEFPELNYATSSAIPQKILLSTNTVLAAFLRGFFDAEGYVNAKRGIGLGINNKKMAKQIQISLLRFSIMASLTEYDNRRNPYSKKHRFTVQITERTSLELFMKEIGFNADYKKEKLKNAVKNKTGKSSVRQIFATGENIRKIIESEGYKVSDFPKVTNFFRNERMMSKEVFLNSVLVEIKSKPELYKKLEPVLSYNLIPTKISSVTVLDKESEMTDIEVKNSNFIANCLVVHNSSQRFSRIREGLLNDWLKKIGEAANKIFGEHKEVIGILLSGGGPVKEMLYKEDYMHADVKKKILGLVDTSYTGDQGIEETIVRGEHLIKEAAVIKEKKIVQRFLEELQRPHGIAIYGLEETQRFVEAGAADTILITENNTAKFMEYECACGRKFKIVRNDQKKTQTCPTCNVQRSIMTEKDLTDVIEEFAGNYGTKVIVVSPETREGKQFEALGGIGALLRYRV